MKLINIYQIYQQLKFRRKFKDKNYYIEGIKLLLKPEETLENATNIYEQYKEAYETRKQIIDNLYNEIKVIKKLRV